MVTCLSATTRLESLHPEFQSPRSRPNQASRHPPPPSRVILPALTSLHFRGVSEYLEDLVSQICAPFLDNARIALFNQLIFDTPHLLQFISLEEQQLGSHHRADVFFHNDGVKVTLSPKNRMADHSALTLMVKCSESDWRLSCISGAAL